MQAMQLKLSQKLETDLWPVGGASRNWTSARLLTGNKYNATTIRFHNWARLE